MVIEFITNTFLNALSDDGHENVIDIKGNRSDGKDGCHNGDSSAERNSCKGTARWGDDIEGTRVEGWHEILVYEYVASEVSGSDVGEAGEKDAHQNDDELSWVILEDVTKESSDGGASRFA